VCVWIRPGAPLSAAFSAPPPHHLSPLKLTQSVNINETLGASERAQLLFSRATPRSLSPKQTILKTNCREDMKAAQAHCKLNTEWQIICAAIHHPPCRDTEMGRERGAIQSVFDTRRELFAQPWNLHCIATTSKETLCPRCLS
jgi:hypothetical protein